MEMLLLAHKVSLELTLSTQHKEYRFNTQISQREGWGEPLRLGALLEMAWVLSNITRNNSPHLKKAWGIYTPQRRKLVVGPRAAPVRPVPHTGQTGVRKTSRWASGPGQTGASDRSNRSGPKYPQNLFLRN
jgi:hypothetical protein